VKKARNSLPPDFDPVASPHVSVFKINPSTGKRLDLLATATVGEGGSVNLGEP
jgi:hypothetical protein